MHALVDSMTPEEAVRPGYFEEGWSAKDVLCHIGAWLAEAGVILERIAVGSYRPDEIDIEEMNAKFYELMKDIPLDIARAQASAARTRMLLADRELPEVTRDAAWWVEKSGSEHYEEHLPRLRAWIAEIRASRFGSGSAS